MISRSMLCITILLMLSPPALTQDQWTSYTTDNGLANDRINALVFDADGVLWIANDGGINTFDNTGFTFIVGTDTYAPLTCIGVAVGADVGDYWFGTAAAGGCVYMNSEGIYHIDASYGLPAGRVNSISIAEDVLWIGLDNGLAEFIDVSFDTYTTADGLPHNQVNALLDTEDRIWIGTEGGLVSLSGSGTATLPELESIPVTAMAVEIVETAKEIWFGTRNNGIFYLDKNDNVTNYTTADGLPHNKINSIAVGTEGKWIGTDGGASLFDETSFENFTSSDGLTSDTVSAVAINNDGVIWFGTTAGLTKLVRSTNAVEESPSKIFSEFKLSSNFPNPFNPETKIRFQLPRSSQVTVNIYSLSGILVRTLYSGNLPAEEHILTWNGKNNNGLTVSSGVYLYRVQAGEFSAVKRMMLIK